MSKPILAIDWDGTLAQDVWPHEGGWLDGAEDALRELVNYFKVYIFSCRVAPYALGDWERPRPAEVTAREIAYIRRMLDAAGLPQVGIWTKPFKIPAVAYIDNRGIRYTGRSNSWKNLMPRLRAMAGVTPFNE